MIRVVKDWVYCDMRAIHRHMKSNGITQQDMADYLNVCVRTFCNYMSWGKMPMREFLMICDLFGWLSIPDEIHFEI